METKKNVILYILLKVKCVWKITNHKLAEAYLFNDGGENV